MKKKLMYIMILTLITVLAGCGGSEQSSGSGEQSGDSESHIFSTGQPTGMYYPLGAAISKIWSEEVEDISVSASSSNGSDQNIQLIYEGEATFGLTGIRSLIDAYQGEGAFEGNPFEDVRVISAIIPLVNHVVVREGEGSTIHDLQGKNIVPGAPGSISESDTSIILEAAGLSINDVNANYVGYSEATDLMRNKQADAAFCSCAINTAAVAEQLATADGKLINLGDDIIQQLTNNYPFFNYTIPEGTYDNQEEDIMTVAQANVLITDKNLSEELVYKLTKQFWENKEKLVNSAPEMETIVVKDAVEGLSNVPLHPGAEKYYREVGIID